jgi:hypothetical protein
MPERKSWRTKFKAPRLHFISCTAGGSIVAVRMRFDGNARTCGGPAEKAAARGLRRGGAAAAVNFSIV